MCLLYTTRTCHEHATRMHVHMQNVGSVWPHVDHFEQAGRGAQQLTPGPCWPLPVAGATKVLRSSRGTGCVSQAALPPPSSVHLQRHSRATFSNCILPLATAQRHRRVCAHRVARKSTHTHSAQRHGAMRLEPRESTRRTFRHHRRRRHTGRDGRAHGGERVAGGRRQEKECHDRRLSEVRP